MNQLYQLTALLAKAMFKKDSPIIPDGAFPAASEPGLVHARIRQLTAENKINTAENMLFETFDKQKTFFLAIGLDFYAHLAEMTDESLAAADFSREEIQQGLGDMLNFYGVKIQVKKTPIPNAAKPQDNPAPNVMADPPKKLL